MSSVNKQNKITHEYNVLNLLNKSKVIDNNNEILTNALLAISLLIKFVTKNKMKM